MQHRHQLDHEHVNGNSHQNHPKISQWVIDMSQNSGYSDVGDVKLVTFVPDANFRSLR